jgi:hypothetical protein
VARLETISPRCPMVPGIPPYAAPRKAPDLPSGQTRGARSLVNNDQPPEETPHDADSDAEPAYLLTEGIGYVRGWTHAKRAAAALQAELRTCGLSDAFPYLHAEVNVFGVGIIELGRITPETAHALTALLIRARTIPTAAKEDTQHGSAA